MIGAVVDLCAAAEISECFWSPSCISFCSFIFKYASISVMMRNMSRCWLDFRQSVNDGIDSVMIVFL